jgi:Mg2+-importing ATPase
VFQDLAEFWSVKPEEALAKLETRANGLTDAEAEIRRAACAADRMDPKGKTTAWGLLLGQFKSPIVLILLAATLLSFALGDPTDALIILTIVMVSALLGFWQERGAAHAVEKLLSLVQVKVKVLRGGAPAEIPLDNVVPGDVFLCGAGAVIPGDCLLLESTDLFVDEAPLTGETFPVEKEAAPTPADAPLEKRTNALFMGTSVVSGNAKALVAAIGRKTEFGKVSERLRAKPPETEFEHGVRKFGYLLMEVTLMLVFGIFTINVFFHKPVFESFLFSLALAVGLTPQLLPAIISINLAHGAKKMASAKVIVKRLASIENFGSMNVLCSDKTGTLTTGTVQLRAALDAAGRESEKVLLHAYFNSSFETGYENPIDVAIRECRKFDLSACRRLDEVPYDFLRKRLSVAVARSDGNWLVTKGALRNVLDVCVDVETPDGGVEPRAAAAARIQEQFAKLSGQGYRVLGVARKHLGDVAKITKDDEAGMTFLGFLAFYDPLKEGIVAAIARLNRLGIRLKVITGDNHLVAVEVAKQLGLAEPRILTGEELRRTGDAALVQKADQIDIFAEIEPNQKERLILALRKAGNVVGYMGDGINDASALHAADVSISFDKAADVAKEVADIVLLERDLSVLVDGVAEGRTTFHNTLKYVFMATSANFGNMFSMAGASLFLKFLPLLPKQILLTNLMTDFPEMTIAGDSVDEEMVARPRRWNIAFIRKFMLTFGLISSVFDYVTFAVLLWLLHAGVEQFRTAWFVESVVSASLVVLVIRTQKAFYRSRPSKYLLGATLAVGVATVLLPFTALGRLLGFVPLTAGYLVAIAVVVALYIASAEWAKKIFYRHVSL